jgi:hypothetical protein
LLRLNPGPVRPLRRKAPLLALGRIGLNQPVVECVFEDLRKVPQGVIDRPVRECSADLLALLSGRFNLCALAGLRDFVLIDGLRRDLRDPVILEERQEVLERPADIDEGPLG